MRSRWILLVAACSTALAACAGRTVEEPVTAETVSGAPQAIIEGIDRGSSVLVQVRLNNADRQPIQISDITMTVLSVKPSACPVDALKLMGFPKPIIAAQSTGVVVVRVSVKSDSPRVCSHARWQVNFSSRATVAS